MITKKKENEFQTVSLYIGGANFQVSFIKESLNSRVYSKCFIKVPWNFPDFIYGLESQCSIYCLCSWHYLNVSSDFFYKSWLKNILWYVASSLGYLHDKFFTVHIIALKLFAFIKFIALFKMPLYGNVRSGYLKNTFIAVVAFISYRISNKNISWINIQSLNVCRHA